MAGTTYSVRAQHVGQANAGTLELLAEDEGEFDLDAWPAVVRMRDLAPSANHHVVEEVSEIRLIDLRTSAASPWRSDHLVADQLAARRHLAVGDFGGDRIGIIDGDAGKVIESCTACCGLLGIHQDIAAFLRSASDSMGIPCG